MDKETALIRNPIVLVEAQKQSLQILQAEGQPLALSDQDRSIVLAASAHPRILHLDDDFMEGDLRIILAKVKILCGIKEIPSDEMVLMMMGYLRKHLRTFTLEEILLAAEMNLSGEVHDGSGKRIEHYGQLDIVFISSLLRGLTLRKHQAFKKIRELRDDQAPRERKVASPKECYDGLLEHLKHHMEFPEFWNWSATFQYMYSSNCFKETDEEMAAWFAKESEKVLESLRLQLSTCSGSVERQAIQLLMKPDAIRMECRKIYVKRCLAPGPGEKRISR